MIETSIPSHFGRRRYYAWNDQQQARYGGRVQKVSVAAGFTCPNRDGSKGLGGCTFCNNAGFTPSYLREHSDIVPQLETGLGFLIQRYPETVHFVAYFQAYSNTYGEFEALRAAYETALAHPRIDGLVIGTRPDCVSDEVLDYLAELAKTKIIELELGIESCDDATLARAIWSALSCTIDICCSLAIFTPSVVNRHHMYTARCNSAQQQKRHALKNDVSLHASLAHLRCPRAPRVLWRTYHHR
jgi:radical SAM superfamily enzyme